MPILPLNLARVSNSLRMNLAQRNLTRTQQSLLEVQNQLVTGRRLNAPSDDPADAAAAMQLRKIVEQQAGYAENLKAATSQLSEVDTAMGDLAELLREAQGIASANVSSTVSADERSAAATVIGNLYNQALNLANRQFQGVYLFGGDRSTQPPFVAEMGGVRFAGSETVLQNTFDANTVLPFMVSGPAVFGELSARAGGTMALGSQLTALTPLADLNGGAGVDLSGLVITNGTNSAAIDLSSAITVEDLLNAINGSGTGALARVTADGSSIEIVNTVQGLQMTVGENGGSTASELGVTTASPIEAAGVFGSLAKLRDALIHNDQKAITAAAEAVQGDLDRAVRIRGQVGAQTKDFEARQQRMEDQGVANQSLLSALEDADYNEAVTRFQMLQTALQANLQTTGRLLDMTLLDFLG